jgi:hypothetical protein
LETYEDVDGLLEGMEVAKNGSDYPAKAAALRIIAALEKDHSLKAEWLDDEEALLKDESEEPPFTITVTAYVDHDLEVKISPNTDDPSRSKLIQNVTEKNQDKSAEEMLTWIRDMIKTLGNKE